MVFPSLYVGGLLPFVLFSVSGWTYSVKTLNTSVGDPPPQLGLVFPSAWTVLAVLTRGLLRCVQGLWLNAGVPGFLPSPFWGPRAQPLDSNFVFYSLKILFIYLRESKHEVGGEGEQREREKQAPH